MENPSKADEAFQNQPPPYQPPAYQPPAERGPEQFSFQAQDHPAQTGYSAPPGYPTQPGYAAQPGYSAPPSYPSQTYPQQVGQGYPPQQGYYTQQPQGLTSTHTTTVITGQPAAVYGVHGSPPPDYASLAWFSCLCCCWPLGIAAILKNNEARSAIARGDYNTAWRYASQAKSYSYISIGVGIVFLILYIILFAVWLIPALLFVSY